MDDAHNTPQAKRKLFPSILHLLTSVYGLLYMVFIILSFFPSTIDLVSESDNPYDVENLIVKLLFVVFLAGYFISWKREGVAGLIFILWWVAISCFGQFVAKPLHPGSANEAIGLGFPLLILGILFIVSWYKKRRVTPSSPSSVGTKS